MQFLDVAVASGYAVLCLSLIVLINPIAQHEVAVGAADRASLDVAISAYLGGVGLPFLAASPLSAICASAERATNSTIGLDVSVGGEDCGLSPRLPPLATSSLSLELGSREVVIQAWLARR